MRLLTGLAALCLALALTGCAASYHPYGWPGGAGAGATAPDGARSSK